MEAANTPIEATPAPAANPTLSAGIALLESAIALFEELEGSKFPMIVKILNGVLLIAKML